MIRSLFSCTLLHWLGLGSGLVKHVEAIPSECCSDCEVLKIEFHSFFVELFVSGLSESEIESRVAGSVVEYIRK